MGEVVFHQIERHIGHAQAAAGGFGFHMAVGKRPLSLRRMLDDVAVLPECLLVMAAVGKLVGDAGMRGERLRGFGKTVAAEMLGRAEHRHFGFQTDAYGDHAFAHIAAQPHVGVKPFESGELGQQDFVDGIVAVCLPAATEPLAFLYFPTLFLPRPRVRIRRLNNRKIKCVV